MNPRLAAAVVMVALLVPSCARRSPPAELPGISRTATDVKAAGWSMVPLVAGGFQASSTAVVTVDRGDSPVEIADSNSLTVLPGGDFSFKRTRVHKGAADGLSEESTAAIRVGKDYYTAGSSGLWVRWDDAIGQPDAQVASFIENEDSLAAIARQCGRLGPADGNGRVVLSLSSTPCDFATNRGLEPTKPYPGKLTALEGSVVLAGNAPVDAALRFAFESTIDGVPVTVGIVWTLKVITGSGLPPVAAPAAFSESRRPRPVRMVESVLGDMVGTWGPGAPESLSKPAGK